MKKKILIVDHDELVLDSLSALLTSKGYQVTKCQNGVDALDFLDHERFGLVICDLELPGITGFDTIQSLRTTSVKLKRENANENIPVVFTSTRTDNKMRSQAERLAPIAFLTKPFDDTILLAIAHQVFTEVTHPKKVKEG